jgi:hypothetical protein
VIFYIVTILMIGTLMRLFGQQSPSSPNRPNAPAFI